MVNKKYTGLVIWYFILEALTLTLCQNEIAIIFAIIINLCFCLIAGKGKGILWGLAPIIIFGVVSFIFVHSGSIVLFKINYVKYTLDAFINGCVWGGLVCGLYYIFLALSVSESGDSSGYRIGKLFPTLGCALSLGLRQMGRVKAKTQSVMKLQENFGVKLCKPNLLKRSAALFMGIINLLAEDSMTTAQSMVMKGYNGMKSGFKFEPLTLLPVFAFALCGVFYFLKLEYIFIGIYALLALLPLLSLLRWNSLWK